MPRANSKVDASRRTVALCYLRKSIVRNGTDYASIDTQRAAVAAECQWRGWTCEWYEDAEGHRSGRHEYTRPQWLRLRSRWNDPDVAAVVGYRLDRISRSVHDALAIVKECTERGVAVVTADKLIDTSGGMNAFANIQLNLLAAIAQFESDVASDRMRDRVASKDASGINHGKPPFGMTRVGEGNAAKFVASREYLAVIKCLELYASGLSYDDVTAKLNDLEIKFVGRDGLPCRWGRESVRTVVGNVLRYVGYHIPQTGYDAKNNRVELEGEGTLCDRWARYLGAWLSPAVEPIISRELADAVIQRRYNNQLVGRSTVGKLFLLTPISYWSGHKLRGENRDYGRFYLTRRAGVMINANVAEAEAIKRIKGIRFTPEVREGVRQAMLSRVSDERFTQLKESLAKAKEEQVTLLDLLLSKRINRETYNQRFDLAQKIVNRCEMELAMPTEVETSMRAMSDLAAMIEGTSPENQKRAVHRLFDSIDLSPDGEIVGATWKKWADYVWSELRDIAPHTNHANDAEGGNRLQQRRDLAALSWYFELPQATLV